MIMTLCTARNLSTNSSILPTASPPPLSPHGQWNRTIQSRSYIVIGQCVQRIVKYGWARTSTDGAARRNNLAATLWKQRRLPGEDLATVATSSCFVRRRSHCGSSRRGAAHRHRRCVRRISISASVISAGFFYFGDAILFYFILSWVVPFCSYAPFDCKFSDFILIVATHDSIAAVDVNVC